MFLSQRAHKALPHSQCAAGLGRQGEENTQDGQSIPCLGLGKDGIQNGLDSLSFDIAHQLIFLPVSNANDTSIQCKSIQNWATSTEGQKYYPSSAPSESTHRCPAPPISSRLREPSNSGRSFLLRLAAQENLSVRGACRLPSGCFQPFRVADSAPVLSDQTTTFRPAISSAKLDNPNMQQCKHCESKHRATMRSTRPAQWTRFPKT